MEIYIEHKIFINSFYALSRNVTEWYVIFGNALDTTKNSWDSFVFKFVLHSPRFYSQAWVPQDYFINLLHDVPWMVVEHPVEDVEGGAVVERELLVYPNAIHRQST